VAKPKTKPYTVEKVDRKVILSTPQHRKNTVFFEVTARKIELLRGISRKSRDFGRIKTKHGGKSASFLRRVLFFSCQNRDFSRNSK